MSEAVQSPSSEEQQTYQSLLAKTFDVARGFNGSEKSLQRVVNAFDAADKFVIEKTGSRDMSLREETEADLAEVSGFEHKSIGQMFLDVTLPFYQSLARGDIFAKLKQGGAAVVETDSVFVKTDDGKIKAPGNNPQKFEIKTEPRLAWLVEDLREIGIYTDDLIIHKGSVDPSMVRQQPYVVIDIPRLNKQIAVCDQVGEVTFVANEIFDPRLYENCSKDTLKSIPQIKAVEMRGRNYWQSEIAAALQGELKPKKSVRKIVENPPKRPFPLTVVLIVDTLKICHEESMKTDPEGKGSWLTAHSGIIPHGPLKGEYCKTLNNAINRRAGFDKEEKIPEVVKGLASFSEWKGLRDVKRIKTIVTQKARYTWHDALDSAKAEYQATKQRLSSFKNKTPNRELIKHGKLKGITNWPTIDKRMRNKMAGFEGCPYNSVSDMCDQNKIGLLTWKDALESARLQYAATGVRPSVNKINENGERVSNSDLIQYGKLKDIATWISINHKMDYKSPGFEDCPYSSVVDMLDQNEIGFTKYTWRDAEESARLEYTATNIRPFMVVWDADKGKQVANKALIEHGKLAGITNWISIHQKMKKKSPSFEDCPYDSFYQMLNAIGIPGTHNKKAARAAMRNTALIQEPEFNI